MKNIKGYIFFDELTSYQGERIFFLGQGEKDSFTQFQNNLKPFKTKKQAVKSAKQYYKRFYDNAPNLIISKLKMKIPISLEEEAELSEENELILLIPKPNNYTILIGAPTPEKGKRYCNSEVQASELIYNEITPYYPKSGKTAYKIASQARSEIARQSEQTGILIATFHLRNHPDSQMLIHYS